MRRASVGLSAALIIGVAAQLIALVVWGHSVYLWVQSIEALAAALVLAIFAVRFRTHDPRESRWPPLLALAAVAFFGAVKNFYVLARPETPAWVVVALLASVGWFLIRSIVVWRREGSKGLTP